MEPERPRSKSKPKSKGRKSVASKLLTNIPAKTQQREGESQAPAQYFLALKNALNNRSSTLDVCAQIAKTLKLAKRHPTQSLDALCQLYSRHPHQFYSISAKSKSQKAVRPIIQFFQREVEYYDAYPLMEREKVVVFNQQFLKWLSTKQEALRQQELNRLSRLSSNIMAIIIKGEKERIIQHMFHTALKIPIVLSQNFQSNQQKAFCETMIKELMRDIARLIDTNHKISHQASQHILQFHQKSFKTLMHIAQNPTAIYPLADFATLIFTSKNAELCKQIMDETFSILRVTIDQKKQELRKSRQMGSVDQKSYEQSESKIKAVLLAASFLKFDTVLDPESLQKKTGIIKIMTLLTLFTFKAQIIKLVDELQKLQKIAVSQEVTKGMFQISKFCSNTNNQNTLTPIIKRIQATKQLAPYLTDQKLLPSSPKDVDPLEGYSKGMEKVLFELLSRIQKSLCHYNLQLFMDQFIENPLTFRSEYFIDKTFQNQHEEVILKLMTGLASKWLLSDNKIFDFSFYLLHLIRKCINEDKMNVLGRFIKTVSVPQLARINMIIFKLSFEDDHKKYVVPESSSSLVQLASLTSGGFRGKFAFINHIMPVYSQQLVWRQIIAHFVPSQHFIAVKSFYNVAHYEFANTQIINELIAIFQSFIEQELIEDVFATFHLLHCILFREKEEPNSNEATRKAQARLFEIIITKSQKLLQMHNLVCTRRRTAISSMVMSQQMFNENTRCLDRLKRMNSHFLRSVHNWIESLTRIGTMLPPRHSYQNIMEIMLLYSKDNQYRQFHQVRYISHYCSEKYISNIISTKVKAKMEKNELLSCHLLMTLKDIMANFMGRYPQEAIENDYCINQGQILSYYQLVLRAPLSPASQTELLKSKLIVLNQIVELTAFFQTSPNNRFFQHYSRLYHESIKHSLIQIALQNPSYVSKYSREFIILMRTVAITETLKNVMTPFQVLSKEQTYNLIYQTCLDRNVEVRLMVINLLSSRFKHNEFKKFLSDKYQIGAIATTMAALQVNLVIKCTAKRIIDAFKAASQDSHSLGLVILLYTTKHLLTLIQRNFIRQQYSSCIDTFITNFHQLWLNSKDDEYVVYAFASKFIEQARIAFILPENSSIQSYIEAYFFEKQRSDYHLETEIKEYLKKDQEFSFEFPPNQIVPSFKQKLIDNLIYSLPFRILAKMMQVIQRKPRSFRTLKYKKDIFIDWKLLQKNKLIKLSKERCQRNIVTLKL